ncbi:MAG TPA: sulfatase-like hydrolase/transferase, partial [Phycisphaerae bacterium]|nr:sulfatase-like hydrolase/transferase [Phycisphaerae bacterium]
MKDTNRRHCRRDFLKWLGFGAAAAVLPGALRAAPRRKPNFVFFLVDDLGWRDLGCYGSTFHDTPNLDRLAASGMRFTDAYAACPVCSPTRASIMTGKFPARLGITDWIPGQRPKNRKLLAPPIHNQLALEEVTIAEVLKEAGYRTFFAGKWHLGGQGFFPEQQGFDINKGGHHAGSPPGGYYTPYKNPKLEDGPAGEYLTDRLAAESVRFLQTHGKEPFLLYLSFYTVHTPIQACKRHVEAYQKKADALPPLKGPEQTRERNGWTKMRQDNPAYASMVRAMDENVGRVLAAIDRLGLAEETVVIFMSDNGGLSTLGRRGYPTSNLPLRAGKGWCYEGGIREPMIIRAPGVTRPGSTCSVPVTSTDFYPTMLELAGLPPRPEQHVDGLSLAPLLAGGKTLPRDAIFWHYPHYHGSTWAPGAAVRAGDWKLVEFYEEETAELYNLAGDIGERR